MGLTLLIGVVLIMTGWVIKRLRDQDRNLTRLQKEMEERRAKEQEKMLRERERHQSRAEKEKSFPEEDGTAS